MRSEYYSCPRPIVNNQPEIEYSDNHSIGAQREEYYIKQKEYQGPENPRELYEFVEGTISLDEFEFLSTTQQAEGCTAK